MRKSIIVTSLLSLMLGVAIVSMVAPALAADDAPSMNVPAAAEGNHPKCANCGMFTDASSTRVQAQIKVDGKTGPYEFECIGCMREKLEAWGDTAKVQSFKILDYTTFKAKTPKMLDGKRAWYLFGTKELEGSMGEPAYIAGFATKDAATKAQKDLGGDVVQGYEALGEKIEAAEKKTADTGTTKVAAKEDTAQPAVEYVCPCTGGCCNDVKSDKPGVCPKCGMTLVPKKP